MVMRVAVRPVLKSSPLRWQRVQNNWIKVESECDPPGSRPQSIRSPHYDGDPRALSAIIAASQVFSH